VSAYQLTKEKGEMDEPTGKVNPPNKGKKKVPPPARAIKASSYSIDAGETIRH
jgi:hypothetical protein